MAIYTEPSDRVYYVPPEKAKSFLEKKPDPKFVEMHEKRAKKFFAIVKDETNKNRRS